MSTIPADGTLPTKPINGINNDDIHKRLGALRHKEYESNSKRSFNLHNIQAQQNFLYKVLLETARYVRFVVRTLIYAVMTSIFYEHLTFIEFISIWVFALGGIIALFLALPFCLTGNIPLLVKVYIWWGEREGNGLGFVNVWNPKMFKSFTGPQIAAAKKGLSESVEESQNTSKQRYFDLDIGKMLLLIAAVVYEHEFDVIREANGFEFSDEVTTNVVEAADDVDELTDDEEESAEASWISWDIFWSYFSDHKPKPTRRRDEAIHNFCTDLGIDFEPISELSDTSSAFAGLFWDPNSNWIVVSFKGTAPFEFGEWLSDLNSKLVKCSDEIPGFSQCHLGFKDRVFPQSATTGFGLEPLDTIERGIEACADWLRNRNHLPSNDPAERIEPYKTVLDGVNLLAEWLKKRNNIPDNQRINVWFTGHSLGCATASLVYAKMVMSDKPEDRLGRYTVLRDAYLWAAPITTDYKSTKSFNERMKNEEDLKTMWRITSNRDVVAYLLPEFGDHHKNLSEKNNFGFAHLGAELIMKDHTETSYFSGSLLPKRSGVFVKSRFSQEDLITQHAGRRAESFDGFREDCGVLVQRIPFIGRLAAHATGFYWDQLGRIGLGKVEWAKN